MNNNQKGVVFLSALILSVIFFRLIPHAPNFTPLGAVALLGAGFYTRKFLAFLVPVLSLWLSDLILNNTVYAAYSEGFQLFADYQIFTFASMILTAMLGFALFSKINVSRVLAGTVGATAIFFILTNFGAWMSYGGMYPKTLAGLGAAYVAGIPFVLNTLLSNVVFGFALFYGYAYFISKNKSLQIQEKDLSLSF
jgi:hypothetical protein